MFALFGAALAGPIVLVVPWDHEPVDLDAPPLRRALRRQGVRDAELREALELLRAAPPHDPLAMRAFMERMRSAPRDSKYIYEDTPLLFGAARATFLRTQADRELAFELYATVVDPDLSNPHPYSDVIGGVVVGVSDYCLGLLIREQPFLAARLSSEAVAKASYYQGRLDEGAFTRSTVVFADGTDLASFATEHRVWLNGLEIEIDAAEVSRPPGLLDVRVERADGWVVERSLAEPGHHWLLAMPDLVHALSTLTCGAEGWDARVATWVERHGGTLPILALPMEGKPTKTRTFATTAYGGIKRTDCRTE
jgi:hypothetical protein